MANTAKSKTVVNPFNQTEIKMAVNAIYSNGGALAEKLLSASQVDFVPSKAAHMCALLGSHIGNVRYEIVAQTHVAKHLWDGTPVCDFPKEGTHAYESAWEDKDDAERSESIRMLTLEEALLWRAFEHFADIARDEADESGKKDQDGGRMNHLRADGTKVNSSYDQFGYIKPLDEYLVEQKARTSGKRRARYLAQLEMVQSGIHPKHYPDVQNALAYCETLTSSDRLDILSGKRWVKLVQNAIKYDEALVLWNHQKALPDNQDARDDFSFATWAWGKAVERFYEDWDLVLHTGVPSWLVNSVFWRTEAAKLQAEEAMTKVAEAMAKVAEVKAVSALAEAEFACEEAEEDILHQRELMAEKRHLRSLIREQRSRERDAELAAFTTQVDAIDPDVAPPVELTQPLPLKTPKVPKGINGARSMKTNSGAASASQLARS